MSFEPQRDADALENETQYGLLLMGEQVSVILLL